MQAYVSMANGSDSATRAKSSLNALKTTARRGAVSAWDEGASANGDGSADPQATLEQLRAAVAEIFKAVGNGLQNKRASAKRCMQRASAILRVDPWFANAIREADFPNKERSKSLRGGLAPCQVRRVTTHIEANLAVPIPMKRLAQVAWLSSSHFSRAFKESFADTPNRYVMRRRVERAQGMMLATDATLGRIAADCGFADQSHFNRQFRRLVGENPLAWRRARGWRRRISDRSTIDSRGIKRSEPLDQAQADGQRPRGGHCLDQIGVLRLNG
jgi:AraC family transcriptional regulator